MSLQAHRKPCNPQGIRGAHGPVPNQPVAGPENPHGNTSGRNHEMFVRRQKQQRRQYPPEPVPAPRPDVARPGPDQPVAVTPQYNHGPTPAEDPILPVQVAAQVGLLDDPIPRNARQLVMPMLEGQAKEDTGNEAVNEGYEADDEE